MSVPRQAQRQPNVPYSQFNNVAYSGSAYTSNPVYSEFNTYNAGPYVGSAAYNTLSRDNVTPNDYSQQYAHMKRGQPTDGVSLKPISQI